MDWADFVDEAYIMHPDLSREQVEYSFISMHQREIKSRIPFVYLSNEEIHQDLQPSFDVVKAIKSLELHVPDDIVNDPP